MVTLPFCFYHYNIWVSHLNCLSICFLLIFFFHLVIKEHKLQLKKNKLHFKPTIFCEWFTFVSCHLRCFSLWKKSPAWIFLNIWTVTSILECIYSLWYLLNQYFMFVVVVIIVGCFHFTASNCILYIVYYFSIGYDFITSSNAEINNIRE